MGRVSQDNYIPDWVAPPGDTLMEALEEYNLTQVELARKTGKSAKAINEIVKGEAGITAETALQLEKVFEISAGFWLGLDREYEEYKARKKEGAKLAEHVEWLKNFNISAMIRLKYLRKCGDKLGQLVELMRFFGISHPDQWEPSWGNSHFAFRKSQKAAADDFALKAWLKKGERLAKKIDCEPYMRDQFSKLIPELRVLTTTNPENFCYELENRCAKVGVAIVFVPELPKTHVSGAARWLSPDKAMIQLSLRYKSEDMLWFSFFHECYHILHGAKKSIFLDDHTSKEPDLTEEKNADQFAADILISQRDFVALPKGPYDFSREKLRKYAKKIGVSPGILLGRLQHEKLVPHKNMNDLKMKFEWVL